MSGQQAFEENAVNQQLAADENALREQIMQRYLARTPASKAYAQRFRDVHADKSSLGAAFDPLLKSIHYPIVTDHASGAVLRDIDGNEYIDILQGLGMNLFGHNPAFIREAVEQRLSVGFPIGPQHEMVGETAKLFTEITGHERVCFSNTGTEAVMTAIRIARTVSGRNTIVVFTNSYHGHSDPVLMRAPLTEYARRKLSRMFAGKEWLQKLLSRPVTGNAVPAAPGIPAAIGQDVLILDYGNPRSLEVIRSKRRKLAAVLVEPVQSRCPELQPVEFLRSLRELTTQHDIALIFDEMVTGFRLHPAGAQGLFDIKADIATYSKIAGGGLPLSAIAGSPRYLDAIDGGHWRFDDDSAPQAKTTFFAGTFCKHPLSLTAAHAMLSHLQQQGPALQQGLNARAQKLVERLNNFTERENLPVRYTHSGSFFAIAMTQSQISQQALTLLSYMLLCEGVFLRTGDKGGFLCTEHNEENINHIASTIENGLQRLHHAAVL